MKTIDRFLNTITMYRLVLYALGILAVLALIFAFMGTIAYTVPQLLISLALLLGISYGADRVFAPLFGRDRNPESSLITGLILFLILAPPVTLADGAWLAAGALIAILSKYVFSYRKKHLFNPAAFGALALTLLGAGITTWWVATAALFPAMLVLGLLIVRKLRRFDLWLSFIVVALIGHAFLSATGASGASGLVSWVVSWPTLFFSTIMLTEPLTMPAHKSMRITYGILSALLFSIPFTFLGVYSSPQLALVLSNVFTFLVSPKGRVRLTLTSAVRQSNSIVEYSFKTDRPLHYKAGQYAEWTLPHSHPDDRGVRRYFTFSSSPEDKEIRLAVRVGSSMSSFKKHLSLLPRGGTLSISNIAGDFTLPSDHTQKLLFIAGGVGITPFMSMIRSLRARGEGRDITLLYLANEPGEFGFGTELQEAQMRGIRTIPISAVSTPEWKGRIGVLTAADIRTLIPDVSSRLVYISGPDGMVQYYKGLLGGVVPSGSIKTDYFPGL